MNLIKSTMASSLSKTYFIIKVMPFDMRNIRATYQRLIKKIFIDNIDKTMELYIDAVLLPIS